MKAQVQTQIAGMKKSATKLLGTIALGGTVAANLMACSPSVMSNSSFASSSAGRDVQIYAFDEATSDRKVKAEKMALVAESLVRDNTTHQAHLLAFRALEQDQFNIRAQFVLKVTAPVMELKGIYKRILPVVSVQPKEYRNYTKFLSEIQKYSANQSADITKFLLDGKPDLHSEREVQDVLEKVVERTDELRDWLKENRKTAFTMNIPSISDSAPMCSAREVSAGKWELVNCKTGVVTTKAKMNIADFEALRLSVAGIQTYLAILTAYSADGAMKNLRSVRGASDTAQAKFESLSKIKGLGELRNTKFQVLLPKVMTDFAVGLKIAKKMHKTLCPAGEAKDQSRKGMLFHAGLCVDTTSYTEKLISTVELMGRGQLTKVAIIAQTKSVDATIDAKAFFQSPPKDLRDLAPTFDRCGDLASLGDGRINGLFVNGEINTVIRNSSAESCK